MNELFTNQGTVDSNRILYTASPFARSSLLHLQEVGELTALQPHTSSRSNLPSYLFFTVVSGEGVLTYQGKHTNYNQVPVCSSIVCSRSATLLLTLYGLSLGFTLNP